MGKSGELSVVEGWEVSPKLEVRWFGDRDVGELESDEASGDSAEPGGSGAERAGGFVVVDGDRHVVGRNPAREEHQLSSGCEGMPAAIMLSPQASCSI